MDRRIGAVLEVDRAELGVFPQLSAAKYSLRLLTEENNIFRERIAEEA